MNDEDANMVKILKIGDIVGIDENNTSLVFRGHLEYYSLKI